MDNVRNMTGSPIAGIDPHELLDVRPLNYRAPVDDQTLDLTLVLTLTLLSMCGLRVERDGHCSGLRDRLHTGFPEPHVTLILTAGFLSTGFGGLGGRDRSTLPAALDVVSSPLIHVILDNN